MRISNGNFLDEDGNEVNLVELLRTGKATPVVNNNDGHHMSAHSGWFTDENGTPVNIIALIDAAIDEEGGDDEPPIGGISINGGNVVTPDANGIINLTISGDGSTVIDSELSASSTNPVQNKVVTGEINSLNESVTELNGSLANVEVYETITPTFEQGTISGSYAEFDNTKRIRTVDVYDVEHFLYAECDSNHCIWRAEFDANMRGIKLVTTGSVKKVSKAAFLSTTKYVRFMLVNTNSATAITPEDNYTFTIYQGRISMIDEAMGKLDTSFSDINLIDKSDWEYGNIDEHGFVQVYYKLRTASVYHVNAGDYLTFSVPDGVTGTIKYEIAYYANGIVTSLSGKLTNARYTFLVEGDIRIMVGDTSSYNVVNFALKDAVKLYASTYSEGVTRHTIAPDKSAKQLFNRKRNKGLPFTYHAYHSFSDSIACDFFFAGADMWTFSASADDNSTSVSYAVRTYNPETKSFTTKRTGNHNLGHANSMSYCDGNDCIICGNGSGDYTLANKFFIVPNASELTGDIDINTNCIIYDCSELDLGAKLNVIWGDANRGRFDICYGITDDNAHIYKILLGRGTNQLTYGTLIEDKGDTEFNGTFAIVETYKQDICGYETCIQGSCFWRGSIYAGIGHNVEGIRIWKMTPQRDGTILTEEYTERMWAQDMTASGNVGGLAVYNDELMFISMGAGNVYSYRI